MDQRKLSATIWVGDQILADDVPDLAEQGFRSIICNRPDGESSGQPPFCEIAEAARAVNLDAHYLPVATKDVSQADAAKFRQLIEQSAKPVFVYCRSGARSTALWKLAQAGAPGSSRGTAAAHAGHASL